MTLKEIVQEANVRSGFDRYGDIKPKVMGHASVYSKDTGEIRAVLVRWEYVWEGTHYVRERLVTANRERILGMDLVHANHWKEGN